MRRNPHTKSKMSTKQHLRVAFLSSQARKDNKYTYDDYVKAFGLPTPPPEIFSMVRPEYNVAYNRRSDIE